LLGERKGRLKVSDGLQEGRYKKKGGGTQPHPNTHTSRGKKNHLIRELALIEETGGFGHDPESLEGIINENRIGVLTQVNSVLI